MNDQQHHPRKQVVRTVFIASLGNAVEWFDFTTYGFFAATIAKVFFPTGDEFSSLMLTLASFGVPFFIRPVGAIVIGQFADRVGRKPAMMLTVSLMLIGTAIIAFTPSYQSIGIAAPILIFIARLIQGISAGGEFGSALVFLAEQNPTRRGLYGSWQFASQGLSAGLSACAIWLITISFTPVEIESWAWRIPFYLGLLIGPVGLWMRFSISETDEFIETASKSAADKAQQNTGFSGLVRGIVICGGLMIAGTASSYVMILYLPTFAIRQLGMPPGVAFAATAIVGCMTIIFTPIAGALSDHVGARRVICLGLVPATILILPLFSWLVTQRNTAALVTCQLVLAILNAIQVGGLARAMATIFPTQNRTLGISVGYNLAVTLFGGLSPLIISGLVRGFGSDMVPGWYVFGAMLVTLATVLFAGRRQPESQRGLRPTAET